MRSFFSKHKLTLMMLTPVLGGVLFFAFSSISALLTINSVDLPEDFSEINVKVKDYNVYEIDHETNELKWTLKAKSAISDSKHTNAKIKEAHMEIFNDEKKEFILEADYAQVNEEKQEVSLYDNVTVVSTNSSNVLKSGALNYDNDADSFYVRSSWSLESEEGFKISGVEGKIKKDFTNVVSRGNATIEKDDMHLKASQIKVEDKKPIVANGNASLEIKSKGSTLSADNITVNQSGLIKANGTVNVVTEKVSCYSNKLEIKSNGDKSPKVAIFTGNPYIIQNGKKIFADLITYDFAQEKVTIEGNVHTGS